VIFATKRLYIDFSPYNTQAKTLQTYVYNSVFTTHVKIVIYRFFDLAHLHMPCDFVAKKRKTTWTNGKNGFFKKGWFTTA